MNAAAEDHKRWTCLRSLIPPILARLRELKEASRRDAIAARRWDAPGADPPTPAEDPTAEYIGQEWIGDAMRVARELESLGFASDAEFLRQQTEFGRPSTPTELEAVQNIATLLARHTPEGDWCVQESAPNRVQEVGEAQFAPGSPEAQGAELARGFMNLDRAMHVFRRVADGFKAAGGKLPSQSTAKPVAKGIAYAVHEPNDEAEPEAPAPENERGVSLYDIAFVIEEDDSAATQRVKVWSDSKRIVAKPIGKCPLDGRRQLYQLSELLSDVKKLLTLDAREVAKYRQALTAKLREPRPG